MPARLAATSAASARTRVGAGPRSILVADSSRRSRASRAAALPRARRRIRLAAPAAAPTPATPSRADVGELRRRESAATAPFTAAERPPSRISSRRHPSLRSRRTTDRPARHDPTTATCATSTASTTRTSCAATSTTTASSTSSWRSSGATRRRATPWFSIVVFAGQGGRGAAVFLRAGDVPRARHLARARRSRRSIATPS